MLLSYRKTCTASSTVPPYAAANITDENPRSFWLAKSNHPGESLTIDLDHPCEVRAVQLHYVDYKSGIFASDDKVYTQFKLLASLDGQKWDVVADLSNEKRDRPNAYIELAQPVKARYVKFEHIYVASPNLAISDIRVFGNGGGELPATPPSLKVRRDQDPRNAYLSWNEVPGAVGYNILWGIQDDKLYQTYQVFSDQSTNLELRALTIDQGYSFAIETFNENGVSKPTAPIRIK